MVADTSAIVSVITNESDAPVFLAAMEQDGKILVSVGTAIELMTVAIGKGEEIRRLAGEFLLRPLVRIVPMDAEHLWLAAAAYRR